MRGADLLQVGAREYGLARKGHVRTRICYRICSPKCLWNLLTTAGPACRLVRVWSTFHSSRNRTRCRLRGCTHTGRTYFPSIIARPKLNVLVKKKKVFRHLSHWCSTHYAVCVRCCHVRERGVASAQRCGSLIISDIYLSILLIMDQKVCVIRDWIEKMNKHSIIKVDMTDYYRPTCQYASSFALAAGVFH